VRAILLVLALAGCTRATSFACDHCVCGAASRVTLGQPLHCATVGLDLECCMLVPDSLSIAPRTVVARAR
jgi:hypothetical protein